jgi:hypothetical protein
MLPAGECTGVPFLNFDVKFENLGGSNKGQVLEWDLLEPSRSHRAKVPPTTSSRALLRPPPRTHPTLLLPEPEIIAAASPPDTNTRHVRKRARIAAHPVHA